MNEETALEVVEGQVLEVSAYERPKDLVVRATEQAKLLMNIVEAQKLYKDIGGKKYLLAEAWEIILAFNEAHPIPVRVDRIEDVDGSVAYEAEVKIVRHGETIAGAIMTCGFDDFPCRGKDGTARIRAAQSAAQTWAVSKAARVKFAWIAVMGGFAPTPAEEMIEEKQAGRKERQEHWCSEHNIAFFKKGAMKGYAHKTEDGWCNEPTNQDLSEYVNGGSDAPEATPEPSPPEAPTKRPLKDYAELVAVLDTLKAQDPEFKPWLAGLFNQYEVKAAKTQGAMLDQLDDLQLQTFLSACRAKVKEYEPETPEDLPFG